MAESKLDIISKKLMRIKCASGRIHEIAFDPESGEISMIDMLAPKDEKQEAPKPMKPAGKKKSGFGFFDSEEEPEKGEGE